MQFRVSPAIHAEASSHGTSYSAHVPSVRVVSWNAMLKDPADEGSDSLLSQVLTTPLWPWHVVPEACSWMPKPTDGNTGNDMDSCDFAVSCKLR